MNVILLRGNHTEWVNETDEDGKTKRVPKLFFPGDKLTIRESTFNDFQDRFKVVEEEEEPQPQPKAEPAPATKSSSKK